MQKIHFFPTPVNGEILYSIAMRYHFLSACGSTRETLNALFDTRIAHVQSVLPSHLGFFFSEVGYHFWSSEDDLIRNHTLLPVCQLFLPPSKLHDIKGAMINSSIRVRAPATTSGLSTQGRQRGALRFCPACIKEDEKNHGIALWRRAHQVPGVAVCWRHNLRLCESCTTCGEFCIPPSGQLLPPPEKCSCGAEYDTIEASHHLEVAHAKLAAEVLDTNPEFIDIKTRQSAYQARLRELGLISRESADWEKVKRALDDLWPRTDEVSIRRNWTSHSHGTEFAAKLIMGPRGVHKEGFRAVDLRIIACLFGSLNDFLSYPKAVEPTPTVISKKRNREHEEWKNEVSGRLAAGESISSIARTCRVPTLYLKLLLHRSNKPLPSNATPIDVKKLNLILAELPKGSSLATIARLLEAPYQDVVAIRMAYPEQFKDGRQALLAQKLELARKEVEALIKSSGVTSRSQVRRLAPTHIDFLYQFDLPWLDKTLPLVKRSGKKNTKKGRRQVDWTALDIEIVRQLSDAYSVITSDPLHPRISVARLSRALGFSNTWLHRKLHRLPKTASLLRELVETGESSRHRRIKAAANILKEDGIPLTQNQIKGKSRVNSSSIRRFYGTTVAVLE